MDIATDFHLAKTMFDKSKMELVSDDGEYFDHNYNICFVWIMLSILGPYIIQYSSYMN